MEESNEKFVTDKGKELRIYKVANTSLFGVQWTTGGELPDMLKGRWTKPDLAKEDIRKYLSGYKKPVKQEDSVFKD